MKVLLGATAAVLLLASPALAQTGAPTLAQCTFTAAPTLADGASADRAAMEAKTVEVNAWLATRQQEEAACAAAIQALNNTRAASGTERQSLVQTWNTEIQEFGARGPAAAPSSRRDRGGVLTRPDGR
jgi:hypothetical protein